MILDERLYRGIAPGHPGKQLRHLVEKHFVINEISPAHGAVGDVGEGLTDGFGGMMETGEEGERGVVDATGVELNDGSRWATPEEIDASTLPDQADGGFPKAGLSNGFKHGIEQLPRQFRMIHAIGRLILQGDLRSEAKGLLQPGVVAANHRHPGAGLSGEGNGHEPDRTGAEHEQMFGGFELEIAQALDNAGQGFGEGRFSKRDVGGDREQVSGDDPGRDHNGFGVGAVQEEEVIAEVGLSDAAWMAGKAGGGIGGNDPGADGPTAGLRMDLGDDAGEFVSEGAGRGEHPGVITAAIDLEIGAAGEGGLDAEADFTGLEWGRDESLDADLFPAVEDGSAHGWGRLRTCGLRGKANFPHGLKARWRR